jgi:hypothetical protein
MTDHHTDTIASTLDRRRPVHGGTARSRVTTTRRLLTDFWTADVEVLESAVGRFNREGLLPDDCRVAFFEIASDEQLHVNVTHTFFTRTAPGWMGPGRVADGFVHNRRFSTIAPHRVARQIRDMVFAARC